MTGSTGDDVVGGDPADANDPADGGDSPGDGSSGEGVFGPFEDAGPIEPGDPSLEHALFVLFGVLVGVVATLQLMGLV